MKSQSDSDSTSPSPPYSSSAVYVLMNVLQYFPHSAFPTLHSASPQHLRPTQISADIHKNVLYIWKFIEATPFQYYPSTHAIQLKKSTNRATHLAALKAKKGQEKPRKRNTKRYKRLVRLRFLSGQPLSPLWIPLPPLRT